MLVCTMDDLKWNLHRAQVTKCQRDMLFDRLANQYG